MTIRRRLLRILLGICLLSFTLVGILALYGGLKTKYELEKMSTRLDDSATKSVEVVMENSGRKSLLDLTKGRAIRFDLVLHQFHQDLEIISSTAQDILEHPEKYHEVQLSNATSKDDGWIAATKIAPTADFENLRENVAIAANIQDLLKNVALTYDYEVSTYAAFENGVDIYIDTGEADFKEFFGTNPNIDYVDFDFFHRPWYEEAKKENTAIFTNAFLNSSAYDKDMIMVGAMPITANGNFAGVAGIGFSVDSISQVILKIAVGKTGFGFVVNDDGQVIISPKKTGELAVRENLPDLRQSENKSLADAVKLMTRGGSSVLPVTIDDKEYYLAFSPLRHIDWSLGVVIEVDEVREPAVAVGNNLHAQMDEFTSDMQAIFAYMIPLYGVILFILLGIVAALSTRLSEQFVRPIKQLSDGVRDVTMGNFQQQLEIINTGDEIESLSKTFNAMTKDLQDYIKNLQAVTAEKERIAAELDVAKSIQQSMLPREFPPFPDKTEFEIYAQMKPAKEVGGDFYDFYLADENHLVVTIADVSGKGIPAALFMMTSKTVLKNFVLMANTADDLAAAMTLANMQLCQTNDELMFVTVFLAMLDLKTGKLIYVSAAHNNPLIYQNGRYEYLPKKKSLALGINPKKQYKQYELQMTKGDILFLYTDGVTEAENIEKELYSNERLEEFLNSTDKDLPLEKLLAEVRQSIKNFVGDAQQSDDITMLALKFNGDEK